MSLLPLQPPRFLSPNKWVGAKHSGEEFLGNRAIIFPNASPTSGVWRNISELGIDLFRRGERAKHLETGILIEYHKLSPKCFDPTSYNCDYLTFY
ncbi:MAG: hypothetical protein HC789_10395 [Microcoleus sp. CSU_2_2]|nr:hypothetical protein [Microcoleus sp. SU_5_3]NJS10740.1 hypothetical protein [Microcoleus sp. CSU_2_2]